MIILGLCDHLLHRYQYGHHPPSWRHIASDNGRGQYQFHVTSLAGGHACTRLDTIEWPLMTGRLHCCDSCVSTAGMNKWTISQVASILCVSGTKWKLYHIQSTYISRGEKLQIVVNNDSGLTAGSVTRNLCQRAWKINIHFVFMKNHGLPLKGMSFSEYKMTSGFLWLS